MCRVRSHAEFVHVRLANHHSTLILEQLHHCRIVWAGKVFEDSRRGSSLQLLRADVVFYRDWLVGDAVGGLFADNTRSGGIVACEDGRFDERVERIEVFIFRVIHQVCLRMLGEGHGGWNASPARCREWDVGTYERDKKSSRRHVRAWTDSHTQHHFTIHKIPMDCNRV
jgi:hypothetical protein